ncbi:uncharacterized protein TM35_000501170, partial [Trypanosoma theileri]
MALLLSVACVCVASKEEERTCSDPPTVSDDGSGCDAGKKGSKSDNETDVAKANPLGCPDPSGNEKCPTEKDRESEGDCPQGSKTSCPQPKDLKESTLTPSMGPVLPGGQLSPGERGTAPGAGVGGSGMGEPGDPAKLSSQLQEQQLQGVKSEGDRNKRQPDATENGDRDENSALKQQGKEVLHQTARDQSVITKPSLVAHQSATQEIAGPQSPTVTTSTPTTTGSAADPVGTSSEKQTLEVQRG